MKQQLKSLSALTLTGLAVPTIVNAQDKTEYASSYITMKADQIVPVLMYGTGAFIIAILAFALYRAFKNKSFKNWTWKGKTGFTLLSLLSVLVLGANIAVNMYTSLIDTYLAPKYSDDAKIETAEAASKALVQEIQEEGSVLLENKSNTLPLAKGTPVNVLGISSVAITYGGAGSGAADESKNVNLQQALTTAGFKVNDELTSFYQGKLPKKEGTNIFSLNGGDYNIYEVPAAEYSQDLLSKAQDFSDTALVVISRNGGEGADLPISMKDYQQGDENRHYLQLQPVEEELIETAKANFDKVVVLVNSSNAMELGFLEDSGIDAALWIGGPGSVGLDGVANILNGDVNPSGRLVDTYAYDIKTNPAYFNQGDFSYTNISYERQAWGQTAPSTHQYKFVNYNEGIYVGYRFYETRFVDNKTGEVDEDAYKAVVQYPFGYGLSYTKFEQEITSMTEKDGVIEVNVKVTNTGDTAGKDAVQVYYTAPYTEGGIEKSHVVLADFGKTAMLEPGASEEVVITFDRDDMASYDYSGEKAYVLEEGDYVIKLMNNAHDVLDEETFTVDKTEVLNQRKSDLAEVTNQFDYAAGDIEYVSRADWEATLPTKRTEDKEASDDIVQAMQNPTLVENDAAEDIVVKDHNLRLVDLVGVSYDDTKWDQLIEQMSVAEMDKLVTFGGYATGEVASVDKPAVVDLDGPAGINGIFQGIKGIQYNSEVVVASTFNKELATKMGDAFANEALARGIVGLYAPAVNIHRTPFSGRNFEYYSEDPVISGEMASHLVAKALENGVYTFTKHFALNDQEANREGVATWSNEQAIREIYLKAFEIPVKEGGATAIMSSFNRLGTLWAGGNQDLLIDVLRGEWGFKGMVITDFAGAPHMYADQALRAGNDLMLTPAGLPTTKATTETNVGKQALRQASKNILYTVVNSKALEVYKPKTKWWLIGLGVADVALVAALGYGFIRMTRKREEVA